MNSKQFLRLSKGAEIYMDDKYYKVLTTDNRGRVQMQRVAYYIDNLKVRDVNFDSYDECMELLKFMRNGDVDCDLTSHDIHERSCGDSFWMHYKDIEEDDIIYSYEQ